MAIYDKIWHIMGLQKARPKVPRICTIAQGANLQELERAGGGSSVKKLIASFYFAEPVNSNLSFFID